MSNRDTTSWDMVRDAAGGSTRARAAFVARYGESIRRQLAARWRGGKPRHPLDDAVQEVFVECLRPGGVLDKADPGRPAGFRPLLRAVVNHVALRFEKHAARQERRERLGSYAPDRIARAQTSASRAIDREWARSIVREAADQQEHDAADRGPRAVLRVKLLKLRFADGLSIRAIAERWHVDASEVHHEYARARRDFEAALLKVLARRAPESTRGQLLDQCRSLLELFD